MGIKLLKITKGVNGDTGSGNGIIESDGLLEISTEYLPGAAAQFGQQFAVEQKIDPQPFGQAKDPVSDL
jgi:hypothetical protein